MKTEVKKVAVIKLVKDYGGVRAWAIQESYNGVIADPNSHKILKREYFNELQNVVMDYLDDGYEVVISND